MPMPVVQCPLGFTTLDKAAALALATATPLKDLRQYINSNRFNDHLVAIYIQTLALAAALASIPLTEDSRYFQWLL